MKRAMVRLVCLFTFATAAHAQTTGTAPSMRAYREAFYKKKDEAAVRAICDSWIKTGKATNNPGLTAQGIARQAYADAKFATIPFEERRAAYDKALSILPPGTSTYRANVLIAVGAHNGTYGDDLEGGLELTEQGLLIARELEDDALLAEGYAFASRTLRFLCRENRALDYSLRSLRYAEVAKDNYLLTLAVMQIRLAGLQSSFEDQSAEIVRKYADRLPEPLQQSFLAHHGSREEMSDIVPKLLTVLRDESTSKIRRAHAGKDAAHALLQLGRAEESLPYIALARKIIEGADPSTEAWIAGTQVEILITVGHLEQAVALGDDAIQQLNDIGNDYETRLLAKALSKAHRELGNNEKANQLTELADSLADDLLVSAFEQTRDSAEQSWDFDVQSRQQAEKIRQQQRETRLREAQLGRLQTLAWVSPLFGLLLWGGFRLRRIRRQRTELSKQVALKTSSLNAATLDAQEQKSRAENLHEKLQNVLKTSSIGIWEWSFAEEKLRWDEQMFEIYGVHPQDFAGAYSDWLDRLHPDDIERATSLEKSCIETDGTVEIEFRMVRPSGEIRHIYSNVFMEKNEHGKPIRKTGINMDITERRTAELALLASEEMYKQLVEEVAEVIWSTTADGILTYLSPQYMKLVGYAPEEHVGNSCLELVHPEDQPEIVKSIELLLASPDTPRTDEFRLRHHNGHYVWATGTVRAVCDEEGRAVRMQGIMRDIHDRKIAEIALAETESKFQRIADNVPGMVYRYVIHPDGSDELTYVSSGSREVFEIEPQELLERGTKKMWERIHKDDRGWLTEDIAKSRDKHEPFLSEYRLVLPEKGLRWVQSSAQPSRAENGDLIWDAIVFDHTDRKETELQLQNTRLQLESLAANVPGMIWRMEARDGIGTITYLSPKSREMFEVEPEEAVADNEALRKYVHPEDLAPYQARQKTAIENVEPFSIEFRIDLPEQGQRWRQCSAHPVKNEAGEVIWNGMTIDITHKKHAELQLQRANEELARATKMKDEFLANMSHELRTPLSAILGMTEGLQEGIFGPVADKQSDSLDVIRKSGSHLLDLINEVLDLAKIESGSFDLDLAAVNVARLCESSLRLIAPQAEKKNIEVELTVPIGLPDFEADEKRLRQVLVNLLSNAVKFTPDGGLVSLEVERQEMGNEGHNALLRISVRDNGIGIASDDMETLFDPFVQVDSSLNRNYTGTGLGLSLVKRFAELHEGSASVTSEVGVGSCFVVDLPLREHSATALSGSLKRKDGPHQSAKSNSTLRNKQPVRVLLAEDNELVAKATVGFLEGAGFDVEHATDGAAAIEAARTLFPDVILMDVQMPVVDGFEAIQEVRRVPKHKETPIIALTGLAMEDDHERCVSAGADHYLSKPFGMQQLVELIRKVVAESQKV